MTQTQATSAQTNRLDRALQKTAAALATVDAHEQRLTRARAQLLAEVSPEASTQARIALLDASLLRIPAMRAYARASHRIAVLAAQTKDKRYVRAAALVALVERNGGTVRPGTEPYVQAARAVLEKHAALVRSAQEDMMQAEVPVHAMAKNVGLGALVEGAP